MIAQINQIMTTTSFLRCMCRSDDRNELRQLVIPSARFAAIRCNKIYSKNKPNEPPVLNVSMQNGIAQFNLNLDEWMEHQIQNVLLLLPFNRPFNLRSLFLFFTFPIYDYATPIFSHFELKILVRAFPG